MRLYTNPDKSQWSEIVARPVMDAQKLEKTVRKILEKVSDKGDKAVKKFTKELDGISLKRLLVTEKEWKQGIASLDPALKAAMDQAAANIRKFHEAQQSEVQVIETMPGIQCWRKSIAIEKVGLYIPGGTAPLFSTILMLGIPAQIAGCKEIVLCSPPNKEGGLHPAILYAAKLVGVTVLAKCGGAQAIGAMAYGTDSIPAVYKVFGPGNQYVTCAKQLVQQSGTAIDMPAGPSEVAVFADATANVDFVAADLLSQAEHGIDSQVICVTTDASLPEKLKEAVAQQLSQLPRKHLADQALENSKIVVVKDRDTALQLLNAYAAEHLILNCEDPQALIPSIVNAGSVFLGAYTPESVGDYASGTNHTLPTNGYAKAYSGVSLDSFVKKVTFQQLSKEGLQAIGTTVTTMAEAEGLLAHANAVTVRLKTL
ncbi:MAG: histidinol dehydrogenase [Chitinophagaceae bacterium]|nr:histidinol dehydrogenase [Chitinophagaceae bacterium]